MYQRLVNEQTSRIDSSHMKAVLEELISQKVEKQQNPHALGLKSMAVAALDTLDAITVANFDLCPLPALTSGEIVAIDHAAPQGVSGYLKPNNSGKTPINKVLEGFATLTVADNTPIKNASVSASLPGEYDKFGSSDIHSPYTPLAEMLALVVDFPPKFSDWAPPIESTLVDFVDTEEDVEMHDAPLNHYERGESTGPFSEDHHYISFLQARKTSGDNLMTKTLWTETYNAVLKELEVDSANATELQQQMFKHLLNRFSSLTQRPSSVTEEEAQTYDQVDSLLRRSPTLAMLDNLWHCRKLIQALRERTSQSCAQQKLWHTTEKHMVITIAVIAGGTTNPLPWLLVLDGILSSIKDITSVYDSVQKLLLGKLVIFSHGSAIAAISARLPPFGRDNLQSRNSNLYHYAEVYKWRQGCEHLECLESLPTPTRLAHIRARPGFRGNYVQEHTCMSIVDARTGSRYIRKFISTNRRSAYPCLSSIDNRLQQTKTTSGMILWYAAYSHADGCKQSKGKWRV